MKAYAIVRKLYLAIAVTFVPCLLTVFLHLYESGDWWELGMALMPFLLLIYVIPFYLLYLELGATVGRLTDGKLRSRGERWLGYASLGDAMLLALAAVGILLLRDLAPGTPISVVFLLSYIALPVLWIVGAIVFKKRFPIKACFCDKGVWIPALALFLVALASGIFALYLNLSGGIHIGGKPDPMG